MEDLFRQTIIDTVIPSIERMIKKEEEHLAWLESKKGKYSVDQFISASNQFLGHLYLRLYEYQKYVE